MTTHPTSRRGLGLGSAPQWGSVLALLLIAGYFALTLNTYYVFVLASVALLAVVGIGLNVLIGLSGQMSFGHVAFYAIGAYTVAILTSQQILSFWLAWPLAIGINAILGGLLALPALRVKGPYLAMITIAFAFVVEHAIIEAPGLTGGHNGIMLIPAPSLGPWLQGEQAVAILALLTVAVSLAMFAWLSRGTWGAAMRAVRDSEIAAESVGINPLVTKVVAFAVSAALAGAAGALYAPLSTFVTPSTFSFIQSILFVLVVLLGGVGTVAGPLVGALVVGLLPEVLSGLEDMRLLFFGALLLVVLWVAPGGVVGLAQSLWTALRQRFAKPANAPAAAPATAAPDVSATALARYLPQRPRVPLAAERLVMQFGGVRAVDQLSFSTRAGAVTSLIGPNGAGKSTVLNMLSGFYRPTEGRFNLGAEPLAGRSALHIARLGVARTYQTSQLFGSLSVADNVILAMARGRLGPLLGADRLRGIAQREHAQALLHWCGFRGDPATLAADLPHVDRRLVEIARALAMDPEAVLLDEPAAGLSREDKTALANVLRRIADAGIGVLVVEHDMTLVMGISDHVVVLESGRHLAEGSPGEVQANPAVQQAYLGESLQAGAVAARPRPPAATPAREVLGVGDLVAGYGAEPVLHGINVQVREGEVVALLGANGAGKSTLMRTLSGLHRPVVSGGIHLNGEELTLASAETVVQRGMILVPEGRQVFPELSVLDNIRLGAFLHPDDLDARVDAMLQRYPRLHERLHQRAGLLSGGEQQMLAVARALMSRPRILLLDEPSLGLAPKIIAELFGSLNQLRQEGMTLVVVDQMAALALALADRAYVMAGGHIVAHGSAADIAADPALSQAYLGGH